MTWFVEMTLSHVMEMLSLAHYCIVTNAYSSEVVWRVIRKFVYCHHNVHYYETVTMAIVRRNCNFIQYSFHNLGNAKII